jgi:ATP-dependent DNA helicase RecG
MSKSELKTKIDLSESETIEFKNSLSEMDQILDSISAFSNTNGGAIYIGIADDGNINGVTIGKGTLETLANEIKLNTDPRLFPNIATEEINSKIIIKVSVQEYPIKPIWTKDKVFVRVGKTNQKITAEKIREMISQNTPFHWDKQLLPDLTIADINENDVLSFVKISNEERNSDIGAVRDTKSHLEKLNLIQNEKLTNAALLLFGKHPQKYFPRSLVRCALFADNKAIDFLDIKDVEGTIIQQVTSVLQFIRRHINVSVKISGKPEREEIWEIPADALREAVINAICHRNYEDTGNVQIRIFDNRLEIWNPGTLPESITLESLKKEHRSIPRNELIARCFYLIKYIEQWGTGTNRIVSLCKEAGLKEPKFEIRNGDFVVTLFRKEIQEEKPVTELRLNNNQKKILKYLSEHGSAKTSEIVDELNIPLRSARRYLSEMLEIVHWSGTTKNDPTGKYSLLIADSVLRELLAE